MDRNKLVLEKGHTKEGKTEREEKVEVKGGYLKKKKNFRGESEKKEQRRKEIRCVAETGKKETGKKYKNNIYIRRQRRHKEKYNRKET